MLMSNLSVGDSATVNKIDITGPMRRRLFDIGLIEGTGVRCVIKSPLGDPTAYQIRGAIIALRSGDSSKIDVSLLRECD